MRTDSDARAGPFPLSTVVLGVRDLTRAETFYRAGMGCEIYRADPQFISLDLGGRSSSIALCEWTAAAHDAGVSPAGWGFRGFTLHYIAESDDDVDSTISAAVEAGATLLKAGEAEAWGAYTGYFADPDGYLWKITPA